ncbi:MAG: hypothetical protein D6730_16740 [Bacteroidetes bacterium]|nr:MAG: hypothetical protein D6730_16740 [Bacteroidota bacterium]
MTTNPRYTILLKEIDLIQESVKNLDDLIFKTKNFAFPFWGGSLFLIADQLAGNEKFKQELIPWLILATAVIPLMFWGMHFYWQKHLRNMAERERIIAAFVNSPAFHEWVNDPSGLDFPVYDPVGWIFTRQGIEEEAQRGRWQQHLVDLNKYSVWDILLYKDAKFYYPLMVLASVVFAWAYW